MFPHSIPKGRSWVAEVMGGALRIMFSCSQGMELLVLLGGGERRLSTLVQRDKPLPAMAASHWGAS